MTLTTTLPATTALLLLLTALPATAQSHHDLRRELRFAGAEPGTVRLRPLLPTWKEAGDRHQVEVELDWRGRRWRGTAQGLGDRTYGVLERGAAAGVGITAVLANGPAPGAPAPVERVRLDLRERGLAFRGTLLLPGGEVVKLEGSRPAALPIDAGWDGLPAAAKRDALLQIVREHPYATNELPVLGSQEALNGNWKNNLRLATELPHLLATFRSTEDVRAPRWKLRHPFGAVAPCRLVPVAGHPYTGVLASGAVGLVRLSLNVDGPEKWNPGVGLKLLVDGRPSVGTNASAFFDPTRADPWLFSHSPETQNDLGRLRLDHLAAVTSDGKRVEAPRAPHVLRFVTAVARPADAATADFRVGLARLSSGLLYRVVDQDGLAVAELRLEGPFVASDGGDRLLHVSHHARPER